MKNENSPICVDLDGTLIFGDLLAESLRIYLTKNPLRFIRVLGWLLGGKAHLKEKLAQRVSIDFTSLPYNQDLIQWLKARKAEGGEIILATASHESYAEGVAQHLGFFSRFWGTRKGLNLKGSEKAKLLISQYGQKGFSYIGDSSADLPIWAESREVGLVGGSGSLANQLQKTYGSKLTTFTGRPLGIKGFLKAIRIHQWSKNSLIFLPALAAHSLLEAQEVLTLFLSFFSFSLCASSIYLLNDVVDLDADRNHHKKQFRPIAAGRLSVFRAMALSGVFALLGLGLALMVGEAFLTVTISYLALTSLYSFWMKQLVVADVLMLASLFLIRIISGGVALEIPLSKWLLVFSFFFFSSLALLKRFSELLAAQRSQKKLMGRGYHSEDQTPVLIGGLSAGLISVFVLTLYVTDPQITSLYSNPTYLWGVCVAIYFWMLRTWILGGRGLVNEDPVVYAMKDRVTYIVFLIILTLGFLAK